MFAFCAWQGPFKSKVLVLGGFSADATSIWEICGRGYQTDILLLWYKSSIDKLLKGLHVGHEFFCEWCGWLVGFHIHYDSMLITVLEYFTMHIKSEIHCGHLDHLGHRDSGLQIWLAFCLVFWGLIGAMQTLVSLGYFPTSGFRGLVIHLSGHKSR